MRVDDRLVQEAFAVARTAYDQPELRAEIERLRAALQDAKDLARRMHLRTWLLTFVIARSHQRTR